MPVKSRLFAAFLAVPFAVSFANAAERSATASSGQKPPAETPVQIMPAGIYPVTPERPRTNRARATAVTPGSAPAIVFAWSGR